MLSLTRPSCPPWLDDAPHHDALPTRPFVSFTCMATTAREDTGDVITFARLKEGSVDGTDDESEDDGTSTETWEDDLMPALMVGDDSSTDDSTGQALSRHEDGSAEGSEQDDIIDDGQPETFASGRFPDRHRTPRDLFVAEPASQFAAAALSSEN